MKERPILFGAPMVRALLLGTKTQTRRLVKPPPTHFIGGPGVIDSHGKPVPRAPAIEVGVSSREIVCPYGVPGDQLWVRETWAHHVQAQGAERDEDGPFVYAADGPSALQHRLPAKWTLGIHMFRWASRITLEITSARVERLQNISEADAIAEGIERSSKCNWRDYGDYPTTTSPVRGAATAACGTRSTAPAHGTPTPGCGSSALRRWKADGPDHADRRGAGHPHWLQGGGKAAPRVAARRLHARPHWLDGPRRAGAGPLPRRVRWPGAD